MSLKILVFPVCIILSLTLIIGYIKPDISSILDTRAEISAKQADLARIDTVIGNIQKLNGEIDERKENEAFVLKYLPPTLDQEHMVDVFNFLASQSGVAVTGVTAAESPSRDRVVPEVTHASVSFDALKPAALDPTLPAPLPDQIKSYNATITAVGSYTSLKDFLARLYHVDRLHELNSLAVSQRTETEKDTSAAVAGTAFPDDFLEVKFDADFPYYKPFGLDAALDTPVFQNADFDFSAVDKLTALINNPLPSLDAGQTGKPNPFQ